MSDDLISRSALIKILCEDCGACKIEPKIKGGCCCEVEIIKKMPTAYDVDKKIERIEKAKQYVLDALLIADGEAEDGEIHENTDSLNGILKGLNIALDIVEGGGTDE